MNKLIIYIGLILSIFASAQIQAEIIGIGKSGDRFVYSVNGVLLSVSPGNVIDSCVVIRHQGLVCSDGLATPLYQSVLTLNEQHKKIGKLEQQLQNQTLSQVPPNNTQLNALKQQNQQQKTEIQALQQHLTQYQQQIEKRDQTISALNQQLQRVSLNSDQPLLIRIQELERQIAYAEDRLNELDPQG